MYKPVYAYRRTPIIPGRRYTYRSGGRRTPPSPWKIFTLILIIAALIALCWWMLASDDEEQNVGEIVKTTRQQPILPPRKTSPYTAEQKKTVPQQDKIPTLSQDAGQGISLEQQESCRKAESLLKQRKFEEARQLLVPLLDDLATDTQFYHHVVRLLNLAADELLANDQFVPPYTAYTVKSGDNLTVIARKHKTSLDRIMEASELSNPNRLRIGMELKIPTNTWSAKVLLTSKRVMLYESDRLIKVYHLHFTNTPRLRHTQYTMSLSNSLWQQLQLNTSDIRDIRNFLPTGTTILIEKDK